MNESLKFCLRNHKVCTREYALKLKEWITEEVSKEIDKSKALRILGVMRNILDEKNLSKTEIDDLMLKIKYEIETEVTL